MGRIGHVIYLHGFASSPGSSKATRFGRELKQRGIPYDCPDLNEPAFETLTVTRMLEQGEGGDRIRGSSGGTGGIEPRCVRCRARGRA
jgi:predicted esterase YcpF (UPF0227 family)